MNSIQLPSRVVEVLAALKTQNFDMKFKPLASGTIEVEVYKEDTYRISFYLRPEEEFDMYNFEYEKMCNVLDTTIQNKSAAVLKYLEGIIEY